MRAFAPRLITLILAAGALAGCEDFTTPPDGPPGQTPTPTPATTTPTPGAEAATASTLNHHPAVHVSEMRHAR